MEKNILIIVIATISASILSYCSSNLHMRQISEPVRYKTEFLWLADVLVCQLRIGYRLTHTKVWGTFDSVAGRRPRLPAISWRAGRYANHQ
jgi:hypothetical protein